MVQYKYRTRQAHVWKKWNGQTLHIRCCTLSTESEYKIRKALASTGAVAAQVFAFLCYWLLFEGFAGSTGRLAISAADCCRPSIRFNTKSNCNQPKQQSPMPQIPKIHAADAKEFNRSSCSYCARVITPVTRQLRAWPLQAATFRVRHSNTHIYMRIAYSGLGFKAQDFLRVSWLLSLPE